MDPGSVLILGSGGYVGSALTRHLRGQGFTVTGVDNGMRPGSVANPESARDYRDLTAAELAGYGAVVLVAGHSSVGACDREPAAAFANNVAGFADLVHKLQGQKLIFASSVSVYVQTGGRAVAEDEPLPEPVSLYDLHKRMIEQYAGVGYPNSYALRLGTMCGPSPNVRTDVLLNSLVWSAVTRRQIRVANRGCWRPLLGINDLCRAAAALIEQSVPPGRYNLASVNVTVGEVAEYVAARFGVPCVEVELPNRYDMAAATDKFTKATGVPFSDTVASLVEELAAFDHAIPVPA